MRKMIKIIFCLFLIVVAVPSMAAGIKKCIDSNGKIIFTDLACPDDATQGDVKGINNTPLRNTTGRVMSSSSTVSLSQRSQNIQAHIESARQSCEAGIHAHLVEKDPDLRDEKIKRAGVVEKRIKGEDVFIKFVSSVSYKFDIYSVNKDVECEATKEQSGRWQVSYQDRPHNVGIQFKSLDEMAVEK